MPGTVATVKLTVTEPSAAIGKQTEEEVSQSDTQDGRPRPSIPMLPTEERLDRTSVRVSGHRPRNFFLVDTNMDVKSCSNHHFHHTSDLELVSSERSNQVDLRTRCMFCFNMLTCMNLPSLDF